MIGHASPPPHLPPRLPKESLIAPHLLDSSVFHPFCCFSGSLAQLLLMLISSAALWNIDTKHFKTITVSFSHTLIYLWRHLAWQQQKKELRLLICTLCTASESERSSQGQIWGFRLVPLISLLSLLTTTLSTVFFVWKHTSFLYF